MSIKNLGELYAHFIGRTDTLLRNFEAPLPTYPVYALSCVPLHRSGQELLVIRLQHLWAEFCRNLIIRSALGNVRTMGLTMLPASPGIASLADVQRIAMRESNGRQPPWHLANFTIRVAHHLGLANYQAISMSIGAVSPIADLLEVRNYIVHPNQRTRISYMLIANRFGMPSGDPVALLKTIQPGGVTLFKDWVAQFQGIAAAAVK